MAVQYVSSDAVEKRLVDWAVRLVVEPLYVLLLHGVLPIPDNLEPLLHRFSLYSLLRVLAVEDRLSVVASRRGSTTSTSASARPLVSAAPLPLLDGFSSITSVVDCSSSAIEIDGGRAVESSNLAVSAISCSG